MNSDDLFVRRLTGGRNCSAERAPSSIKQRERIVRASPEFGPIFNRDLGGRQWKGEITISTTGCMQRASQPASFEIAISPGSPRNPLQIRKDEAQRIAVRGLYQDHLWLNLTLLRSSVRMIASTLAQDALSECHVGRVAAPDVTTPLC
jgi:hypothetical protein